MAPGCDKNIKIREIIFRNDRISSVPSLACMTTVLLLLGALFRDFWIFCIEGVVWPEQAVEAVRCAAAITGFLQR